MLCIVRANAQGLSLSFNLTETDTLAKMIAASKKYDISSLTLSGYISEINTKYIKDLNENGRLTNLNLSGVTQMCTYYEHTEGKTFPPGHHYEIQPYVKQFGSIPLPTCPYVSHGGIKTWCDVHITITEEYHEENIIVTLYASYYCPYGDYVSGSKTITKSYPADQPKLMFENNSFAKLVLPDNLEEIGGENCRFRVKSCDELVMGSNLKSISAYAFKGSNIKCIKASSQLENIGCGAFENATGELTYDLLSKITTIGNSAFNPTLTL